ncbi:CLUMA_CG012618, isoform A [Clunio marinus]|uniref:CLUMA_CG012618, isoform A n=1 Tax=Clunio marinus TaxID=568069 RepID=A0A1J1IHU6_9DIPT|nr:CLUMA_CG012618, isoform A [Clunio marinus]
MESVAAKATEKIAKKSREEKLREQKIESEILKSLNGITDSEQKFQTLLHRCVEAERISKSAQLQQKQNQKTIETLLLEKDNLAAEHQRTLLTKSKLESLCRELQNQNKTIKEDSLSKIREEEERRKETQAKFQQSLNEIQILMNENSEKNKKLEHDNHEMSSKFKQILNQYEEREKQMDRINKQMELVTQLNEAKLAKANVESIAEKEAFLKQTAILEETITILKRQLSDALGSEKALKAQVDLYSSKYGEFTKTFEGYKTDMTKMSKKTFKMEKEMLQWKIKYEKANAMLLDLISEKQIRDEHITKTAKQLFHLQKLCRTLSSEKKAFYGKLVECNIDIPEVKISNDEEVTTVPEPVVEKGPDKLDKMMKSRDELRKNLDQLQTQLTGLQLKEEESANNKKTKSKKSKKSGKNVENGMTKVNELEKIESKPIEESAMVNGNNILKVVESSDPTPEVIEEIVGEVSELSSEVKENIDILKDASDSSPVSPIDS